MLLEAQSGMLTGAPGFSSTWSLHVVWVSPRDCRKYQYTASLVPHSVAKTCQDQVSLRGREKTLFLHEPLRYSNPSHLWRKKQTEGFIVGALILLLFIKKLPAVDSIPTRCRETESLLLDLLPGENRVRTSHSDEILTSRGLGATWGYVKYQELCRLEDACRL